jgi:hypothetical protein
VWYKTPTGVGNMPDIRERWIALAALAAKEQDPAKLKELTDQINDLMDIESLDRLEAARQIDELMYIERLHRLEAASRNDERKRLTTPPKTEASGQNSSQGDNMKRENAD